MILTFTPYGDRLEPETVTAVTSLEWDGEITHVFQHAPQTGDARQDILNQYQRGRELFLSTPATHMLVIESDIIPPRDTLTKLMELDADCAYGVYRFRNTPVINIFNKYSPGARNPGEPLDNHPHKLRRALQAQRIECSGAGLGCVLIKRHVLKNISFRLAPNAHCDTWFNLDVFRGGYSQRADMTVVCGHKDEHGAILWPGFVDAQKRV